MVQEEVELYTECEVITEEVPIDEDFVEEIIIDENTFLEGEEGPDEVEEEDENVDVESSLGMTIEEEEEEELVYEEEDCSSTKYEITDAESSSGAISDAQSTKHVRRQSIIVEMDEDGKDVRLRREATAKRTKIAHETPEERQLRLERKKEINRRYFSKEAPEQKQLRLMRKADRDKRNRLDLQLQFFHPDMLAEHGIEVLHNDDTVEIRVPWEVPPDETEEEQRLRYEMQEQVINDMIALETPAMEDYRKRAARAVRKPTARPRFETEEMRLARLSRQKELSRLRRQNETPQERIKRLDMQRIRTQRNRDQRNFRLANTQQQQPKTGKRQSRTKGQVKEEQD